MAPVEPRKSLKLTPSKDSIARPIMKTKKLMKKNYQSFSIYLYEVLRTAAPEKIEISRKAMLVMNHFVIDMLESIAVEGGRLAAYVKKSTLSSREIESAVKLVVPGELSSLAIIKAAKAIKLFHKSRELHAAAKAAKDIVPDVAM